MQRTHAGGSNDLGQERQPGGVVEEAHMKLAKWSNLIETPLSATDAMTESSFSVFILPAAASIWSSVAFRSKAGFCNKEPPCEP